MLSPPGTEEDSMSDHVRVFPVPFRVYHPDVGTGCETSADKNDLALLGLLGVYIQVVRIYCRSYIV